MGHGLATAETVTQFRNHGWAYLPRCLEEEQLAVLRTVLDDALESPEKLDNVYGEMTDKTPAPRTGSMAAKQALNALRETRLVYDELKPIITGSRLAGTAKALLGANAVRLFADTFLNKPGGGGGGGASRPTPWHQDWPLFPFDRRDQLNIWIAVDDLSAEQGGLQVISGSHRLGPIAPPSDFTQTPTLAELLREDDIAYLQTLECEGDRRTSEGVPVRPATGFKAGDAIAFHGLTLHGAAPNLTDRPRRAYSTVWIDANVRYTGMPYSKTDGLGLTLGETFALDRYDLVS